MKRPLATLMLLAGASASTPLVAQTPTQTPSTTPAAVTPYLDKLIDGSSANLPSDDTEDAPYNRDGWSRYWRFETRAGTDPFNDNKTLAGLAFFGLIETPNYGVLSADVSGTSGAGRTAFTLRQRGLPLDSGWRANNEAGVIGLPMPSLARSPSRVYVPGNLIEGLSTEWNHSGRGLQLQLGSGQPGRLEGAAASGYRALSGRISTVGAQLDSPLAQLAARLVRSNGLSLIDTPSLPSDYVDAKTIQLMARLEDDNRNLQGSYLTSQSSQVAGNKSKRGFWLDGEWKQGPFRHAMGLYGLDPDLSFAGQTMANDLNGTYARTTYSTRQWSADASLDWLRSISKPVNRGTFTTGNVRMRYSKEVSYGLGASVRNFNGKAWSTYLDTRWQNDWGHSNVRLNLSHELDETRSKALTLDHEWQVPTSWSVSTSITAGRDTSVQQNFNRWGAALSVGAPIGTRALLRGNVNTDRVNNGQSRTGANVNLNWRISPQWSLEGSFNYARGQYRTLGSLDPLAPPVSSITPTSNRAYLLVLRFEERAGSRSAPLGGRAQDGGGRIEGTVYLDANRNSHQEASETGAAGVTVYLDNLYAVRTDAQGRFVFPFVAAGKRVITVLNETLPLPWAGAGDGRNTVEVRVREDVRINIGVVRQSAD